MNRRYLANDRRPEPSLGATLTTLRRGALERAVLVVLSGLPVVAEEVPIDRGNDLGDLRLMAGPAPAEAYQRRSISVTPPSGTASNDHIDAQRRWGASAFRIALQQVDALSGHSPAAGWVVGYELALDRSRWQDRDDELRTTSATLDLVLGYSWSLTRRWHLELSPLMGAGISRATLSSASGALSDRGVILEEAARLAIFRTAHAPGRGVQMGFEGRIDATQSRPLWTASDPLAGTTTTRDRLLTLGWSVLGSIGYRY